MSTSTLSTFFAVLSLICAAGVVMTIALAVAARPVHSPARVILDGLGDVALWLAWLVAAVTTAGSLYYSLVAHFTPCDLCWYQRICAYPLTVILLVAAVRRDARVWTYALPLTSIGGLIAAYHTQLQTFPTQRTFCSTLTPCTTRYVWEFGFVSLPFMALCAFCFVTAMLLVASRTELDSVDDTPERHAGDLSSRAAAL